MGKKGMKGEGNKVDHTDTKIRKSSFKPATHRHQITEGLPSHTLTVRRKLEATNTLGGTFDGCDLRFTSRIPDKNYTIISS